MKVLILGGNRFFGKRLAQKFIDEKADVTLLNRQSQDDGFGSQVKRLKCDRTDQESLARTVADQTFDVIYDQICFEAKDARAACEIFKGKTPHYIFTSSQSVYVKGGANLKESDFNPYDFSFTEDVSTYAEAKQQCESVFFHQTDLKVSAIRFPIVLGPDDYTKRLTWHIERIANRKAMALPAPEARISFVHSQDAAHVLHALAKMSPTGPLNVCSKDPVVLNQLMSQIAQSTNGEVKIDPKGDESPFGIDGDWFMSTEKLEGLGLSARKLDDWLPSLLETQSAFYQLEKLSDQFGQIFNRAKATSENAKKQ